MLQCLNVTLDAKKRNVKAKVKASGTVHKIINLIQSLLGVILYYPILSSITQYYY